MAEGRRVVAPTAMRVAIGRRMVQSKREAPHFYVSTDLELDAVMELAARRNAAVPSDERLTVTAFLVRAVAVTLGDHSSLNAIWHDDALEVVDAINVGVAIAVDEGLIAPAVLDCAQLDVAAVGQRLREVAARARSGRLRGDEITGPTFTVSNLGMFDVSAFTAIIAPPQVAILATGRTEGRPVVRDGEVVVRQMMTATLSADHRAIDGVVAARFLGDLKARLRTPHAWVDVATGS